MELHPVTFKVSIIALCLILMSVFSGYVASSVNRKDSPNLEHDHLVMLLNQSEKDQFSSKALYTFLQDINIKFPDIVFAQSILETGAYNSEVFRVNNNLFGMKEAQRRPTMSKGTELNHARYDNWKESVIDYALYQARYLSDIKTREQYFEYLGKNYAEDPKYILKINDVIKNINGYTNKIQDNCDSIKHKPVTPS